MVELAAFLGNLGLSQYLGTFADNDIDGTALLELEEAHLKEIGLSLGHRVRLMKAIVELRMANGTPAPVTETWRRTIRRRSCFWAPKKAVFSLKHPA